MESAPSQSEFVRSAFLPASPHPATPPVNPPPLRAWNDTWWKRLLNVVTHLLWFVGLATVAAICNGSTGSQKPDAQHAFILVLAVSTSAFGFQWIVLHVLEGSVINPPWRIWAARGALLAVAMAAIIGIDYLAPRVPPPSSPEISFDDLIPAKPAVTGGFVAPVEDRISYLESAIKEESERVCEILVRDDAWSPNLEEASVVKAVGITSQTYAWWQSHVLNNQEIPAKDRAMVKASVNNAFQMSSEMKALQKKAAK